MTVCPVCSGSDFPVLVPASRIEAECQLREQFIRERLSRPATPDEMKDLTDFFHGAGAEIASCSGCSLLVRHELEAPPTQTYSEDEYDPAVMDRQYPRYLDAFRRKADPFRNLLPAGARVLEIGSHYGAFLATAREWGWRIEGVDVGRDTSRFARSKGFTVHQCDLPGCGFEPGAFDGIFIWNCFEQISDPKPLLRECKRVLRPDGLLVLRTPNGFFYRTCQRLLAATDLHAGASEFLLGAMGYNNLLGFPYLYGHSAESLRRLAEGFGFRHAGMLNSELIVFPLPENPSWVEQQERAIDSEVHLLARSVLRYGPGTLAAPWIEVWFHSERNTSSLPVVQKGGEMSR